eukprot:TRINITY_DN2599_c0_g1_i2.p1 TRINITY_DN2599_c0_g1~~TRINITY_DN2599_c0_g1_i2.p1  ORF type:complete len:283 (-),score=46.94 TRINITY_DN2599_c0_g1_i2:40-888(-)
MANTYFMSISASDIVSKYVGDSEKTLRLIFKEVISKKPAILFIDEIDSMCSSRQEGENEATKRLKTEFLVRMTEIDEHEGVLVLGATNRPFDLDSAIRRRFEKRIFIPLPNSDARKRLFEIHLGDESTKLSPKFFKELSQLTEGYSGADISILVREALMMSVRDLMQVTHWKKVPNPSPTKEAPHFLVPCAPGTRGAIQKTLMEIEPQLIQSPSISEEDFRSALKHVKPSVAKKDLEECEKFTKLFGSNSEGLPEEEKGTKHKRTEDEEDHRPTKRSRKDGS